MTKIDEATARSIMSMRNSAEFKRFTAWLETSLKENDISLRYLSGEPLHRAQGASIVLEKIIDTIAAPQK